MNRMQRYMEKLKKYCADSAYRFVVNAALGLYDSMPDRDYLERKFEALMGTPLLPGFVSKWLIGSAAIETGTAMGMVGVAALLISAVLTAIYLMGPAMSMYFRPLEGMEKVVSCDPGLRMKLPFAVLTAAIVLCGLFSDPIITLLAKLSAGVM